MIERERRRKLVTSKLTIPLRQGACKSDSRSKLFVSLELMSISFELAKTSRAVCQHCDFIGKPIPKGSPKIVLRRDNPSRQMSLCASCAQEFLALAVNDMKKVMKVWSERYLKDCSRVKIQ